MRVIAGAVRGCSLVTPNSMATRPTSDRLKENLFNILAPYVPDAAFLDLFSGSGAIAIEALSRGASRAVLVESSPKAAEAIRANLRKTKLSAALMTVNAEHAVPRLAEEGQAFDLIFMDPPYEGKLAHKMLNLLDKHPLLTHKGIIVVELSARGEPPVPASYEMFREKIYGNTRFAFYRPFLNSLGDI